MEVSVGLYYVFLVFVSCEMQKNMLIKCMFVCLVKFMKLIIMISIIGWWRGLAVTRWSRSTKLLYARPG